jgi:hypothetical protein
LLWGGGMRLALCALLVLSACAEVEDRQAAREADERAEQERVMRDIELLGCDEDDRWMVAEVRIVNGSSERSNYSVEVAYTSPDGSVQLETATAGVRALEPGQSATDLANTYEPKPAEFECSVVDVFRYSDE